MARPNNCTAPNFDPSPEQIAADCAEIQKTWSEHERERRRGRRGRSDDEFGTVETKVVRYHGDNQ